MRSDPAVIEMNGRVGLAQHRPVVADDNDRTTLPGKIAQDFSHLARGGVIE
jgi:hypothetical protein